MRLESDGAYRLLLVLLLVRVALVWVGFDRSPMASENDEVLMADQAATLAAGGGLRAASFEGLPIGTMYAHHPPVYSYLMAGVFKVFGVNVYSLRAPSLLAYCLFDLLCVLILARLGERQWLTPAGRNLALLLLVCESTGFMYSRFGRIDPVALLFCALAFLALLPPGRGDEPAGARGLACGRAVASALFMGLALSSYIGAAFAAVAWALALLLAWRKRPWQALAVGAVPLLVFAGLWVAVYRERSVDGVKQMCAIAKYMVTPGLGLQWIVDAGRAHDLRRALQSGGLDLLSGVLLGTFGIVGAIVLLRRRKPADRAALLWALGAPLICWGLMEGLTGQGRGKLIMILPLVYVAAAIVFSRAPAAVRRLGWIATSAIAAGGAVIIAAYLGMTLRHWRARSPDRFAPVVANIPRTATVAGVPQLWLTFQERHQPYRDIDFGFGPDRVFWEHHVAWLAKYDYVLLPPDHPLLQDPALKSRLRQEYHVADFDLIVLAKPS